MSIAFFAGGYQIFAIGSYGVTSLDILMILFYFLYFIRLIIYNDEIAIPKSLVTIGLALFIVSILLSSITIYSSLYTSHIVQYFKSSIHIFQLMLISIIFISNEPDMKLADNLFKIWIVSSLILNIFGIYQIIARAYDLPLAWLNYSNVSMTLRGTAEEDAISQLSLQFGNFFRATSIFSEPTALATFNLYILIFTIIPKLQNNEMFFRSKVFNTIVVFFAIIGLFLTFSLTGILGLFLIVISIFILESRKAKRIILKYLLIISIIIIPTDLLVNNYLEISVTELFSKRISGIINKNDKMSETTDGESFITRQNSFNDSKKIWLTSPIIGVGLGLTQYQKNIEIDFSDYSIMAILAEMGIIGAISFSLFFYGLFYIGYKANKYSKSDFSMTQTERRQFGIIFYVMLVHFEINYITGNNVISPNLWFVLIFILIPIYRYMQLNNYSFINFKLFDK